MRYVTSLTELRRRWAARPSTPVESWFPRPPSWAARSPQFDGSASEPLWTHGIVSFGWVYLADTRAWEPGTTVYPASVLFSDDPESEVGPEVLVATAQAYWELRRAERPRAGARLLHQWVTAERPPDALSLVPSVLSEGRVVWRANVLAHRSLPGGKLSENLIPIVRDPQLQLPTVTIVPPEFWPTALAEAWATP